MAVFGLSLTQEHYSDLLGFQMKKGERYCPPSYRVILNDSVPFLIKDYVQQWNIIEHYRTII